MLICYGTHNSTDGKAVEVVINKDEYAQNKGADGSTRLALYVLLCPVTECL